VDYILETFPIVKRKDEQAHGAYRTKRVILDIYDAMQQAMETGTPYLTRASTHHLHTAGHRRKSRLRWRRDNRATGRRKTQRQTHRMIFSGV
jgi:hypothetical protein